MSTEADIARARIQALNPWQGKHALIWQDTTPELLIEGARMSAKSTLCLDKELHFLKEYPGIHSFMCRYSDTATRTKLRPRFETICQLRGVTDYGWNERELAYEFSGDSKMYAFGLKAANAVARYEKLRGLDVSRVYNDQSEELPGDIGQELQASMRQKGFPHQITFSPNPIPTNHWLANKKYGGFPLDNSMHGRRMYQLSIYDNAYNLEPEDIARMERTYPPDHAKHGPMILGTRGPNVFGNAVYDELFVRALHVRDVDYEPDALLLEGFDFGQHNPCWVAAQRLYSGGLALLGGIIGENVFLSEFLPIVERYRAEWFADLQPQQARTCCPPPAALARSGAHRYTGLQLLRQAGFMPIYREHAGADVQLTLIDRLSGYMQRRIGPEKHALAVNANPTRWLQVSRDGIEQSPFVSQAFESNYVWDEHVASVAHAPFRKPKDDDWFANAMRCVENIELCFCANLPTEAELEARRAGEMNPSDRAVIDRLLQANAW